MDTTQKPAGRGVILTTKAMATKEALHRLIDGLPEDRLPEAARLLDGLAVACDDPQDSALIERWVERHPSRGTHRAVLVGSGVPVYALVGYLDVVNGDLDQAAQAYGVPREAVEAALAYYRRNRFLIDAWIAMNAA